jgi:hypothetical protein
MNEKTAGILAVADVAIRMSALVLLVMLSVRFAPAFLLACIMGTASGTSAALGFSATMLLLVPAGLVTLAVLLCTPRALEKSIPGSESFRKIVARIPAYVVVIGIVFVWSTAF